jgi:TM2 domain-containing membrane protein YozV
MTNTDTVLGAGTPGGMASPGMTSQKYCSGCGTLIHTDAQQCPRCGAPQAGISRGGRKSRVTAIVLALLLGGLGAHKFYLGRAGWGILYLLFFWTFIPAVIAFVEAIIYITQSDTDFARKYG